jgi:nitroimidazol reductase NimA-like FMN-containing flavoprotein (pyridoxamine 5'-phosphate oxidase superfamily)
MRALDDEEITELLGRNGVGVLAFNDGSYPYPLPVAFGYDPADDLFVVQLEGDEHSYKKQCLEYDRSVGMTVYEETEPGNVWQSVVLQGSLVEISHREAETALAALARNTQDKPNPLLWGGLSDSGEITPYQLQIEEMSGRELTA